MIVRSALWLTVGFLLVAPHGTDFGALASQTRDQAIAAGSQAAQQFVTKQILANPTVIQAVASTVVDKLATPSRLTSSSHSRSADLPMQSSPATAFVFPRARPAALG